MNKKDIRPEAVRRTLTQLGSTFRTKELSQHAIELGPQSASDSAFTARMRLHQSWYRARVLEVECGTGPSASDDKHYGNMLRSEDAQRGLNFLSPQIYEVARARLRDRSGVVEPFRLLHNMLSSQPLCFNLFGPLVTDPALATRLLRTLPQLSVARVLSTRLEYTPGESQRYLEDRTAFDAYIEYEQADGTRAFIGIEVKLTEPFSKKTYDSPSYRRWMTGERSPWRTDAAEHVAKIEHNQLWRDHLLAIAHRDQPGSTYAEGKLMLVRHPEDRSCERVVAGYQQLLREGDDSFIDLPLDVWVELARAAVADEHEHAWLAALTQRYLTLEASRDAH